MQLSIKRRLREGKAAVGSWLQACDLPTALTMARSGYDWIGIDLEMVAASLEVLPELFANLSQAGVAPFARVRASRDEQIQGALRAGAEGVVLAGLDSREELERGIGWATLAPIRRPAELVVVAQIENVTQVADLDQLLAVSGLDAALIEPDGLAESMALAGQFEHPDYVRTEESILRACRAGLVPSGIHVVRRDAATLRRRIAEGCQFIAYANDSLRLASWVARNQLTPSPVRVFRESAADEEPGLPLN